MTGLRKAAFNFTATAAMLGVVACGEGQVSPIAAELVAPDARSASVVLTPALEVSTFEDTLLGRMVIEDIQLNLADVRLLGADPRIPAGGLGLLDSNQVVAAFGEREGIELPYPSQFIDDEDLAVYVRIDETPELDGASVVVRARLYKESVRGGSTSLLAQTTSATDPDGDPASDPEDELVGATDPDGDPALPGGDCDEATDPDGDPAKPCRRDSLVQRGKFQPYVTVELRDTRSADLVSTLADESGSEVVVGIPASRWFTPDVLRSLDAALDAQINDSFVPGESRQDPRDTIIVVTHDASRDRSKNRVGDCANDDYFLSDAEALERLTIRR